MSNTENSGRGVKRIALSAFGVVVLIAAGVILLKPGMPAPAAAPLVRGQGDIVARGRIEPLGRVRAITGSTDSAIIRQLLVDQGDKVESGQILAVLDGFEVRKAEVAMAERNLALVIAQRTQIDAGGGKSADVAAQANVIAARQAALVRLQKEWDRRNSLYSDSVVSKQSLEELKAQLDQAQNEVGQAKNTLKSLTEVRGVDDNVAAAQVEASRAAVQRAQAELERLQIRAPSDGTILSIQARSGEAIQADGILRMADLSHLIAVADVDEADIGHIRLGMSAEIGGDILALPVKAKVSRIAYEVYRQKRPASDILIGRDAKIVEVELTPDTALPPIAGGEVMIHLLAQDGH